MQDDYRLVLVTKGDLLDQERKLAESGLRDMFTAIEIVSDKTPQTYQRIFDTHGDGPARGMMIGNSMKSDVVPMIHAGGHGVYIPHGVTWALEHAPAPSDSPRFHQITRLSEVAGTAALIAAVFSPYLRCVVAQLSPHSRHNRPYSGGVLGTR